MTRQSEPSTALGFEQKLREAPDLLPINIGPVEFEHAVPGLMSELPERTP